MKSLNTLFIILLSVLLQPIFGQQVIDALTGMPIPFANVQSIENPDIGTSTDEAGLFQLDLQMGSKIRISNVGYKPQTAIYEGEQTLILLEKSVIEFDVVTVKPDESKAMKIIEKLIQNRKYTAPKQSPYFQAKLYNKFRIDYLKDSSQSNSNQMLRLLEKNIEGNSIYFSESAVEYYYEKPNKTLEKIVANRVAGFKDAGFNITTENLIDFDLNSDFISIMNKEFLSPLSKGSDWHYGLTLEEENIYDNDTTWLISFYPDKNTYDLLRGHVIIHSDGYAIEEMRLTNNPKDPLKFDIYHHFKKFGEKWFPDQMLSKLVLSDMGLNFNVLYDQQTSIKDVKFDPIPIQASEANQLSIIEGANQQGEILSQYRNQRLDSGEVKAIKHLDEFGQRVNLDKKINLLSNLTFGRLPIGKFNLQLDRVLWANQAEGIRLGAGIETNEKFNENFTINAFYGIGTKDKRSKYGGGFEYHFNKEKTVNVYTQFQQEIYPLSSYIVTGLGSAIISNFFNEFLDDITSYKLGLRGRIVNWDYDLFYHLNDHNPRYAYEYAPSTDRKFDFFSFREFGINIRYLKRKYFSFYNYKIPSNDFDAGLFEFKVSHAPANFMGSNLEFTSLEAFGMMPFNFKTIGRTEFAVHTGLIFGQSPLSKLHIANGNFVRELPFRLDYAFNTMPPFTFFADKYLNFFVSHRFGRIYKSRISAPILRMNFHSGWGTIENPSYHKEVLVQDYARGYYESGIILDQILRYELLGIVYLGLNVSVWHNFGEYAHSNELNNFVWKIGFSIDW